MNKEAARTVVIYFSGVALVVGAWLTCCTVIDCFVMDLPTWAVAIGGGVCGFIYARTLGRAILGN